MNTNEDTEEWRQTAIHPYYEVSNLGRVRSWAPLFKSTIRPDSPRMMTINDRGHVYPVVNLWVGKRSRPCQIHRLVAAAFLPPQVPGQIVRHLDGNNQNPRATNLAWGTQKENIEDGYRHGASKFGEQSPVSKLSNQQAKEIFDSSDTCSNLAVKYGVTPTTISNIRTGRNRARCGFEGVSPGAVGIGGRTCPKKITAEIAREIFLSKETLRVLAERHGIAENSAYQIQNRLMWERATHGLKKPRRARNFYGKVYTVSPLKTLTEEQVREIFVSPLNGRQIALKMGTVEGHVSMIRNRKVCQLITKELVAPDRPKTLKLDAEKAREIFVTTGPLKETADKYGVTFNMVSLIRRRCSWAHATKDLPDVNPVVK